MGRDPGASNLSQASHRFADGSNPRLEPMDFESAEAGRSLARPKEETTSNKTTTSIAKPRTRTAAGRSRHVRQLWPDGAGAGPPEVNYHLCEEFTSLKVF